MDTKTAPQRLHRRSRVFLDVVNRSGGGLQVLRGVCS